MRKAFAIVLLLGCLSLRAAAFDVRAVYVDHRTQVQTLPALKELAKKAADGGMNAIVMEWEATFPFEENATLKNKYAFRKDEVEDYVSYCTSIGIDVIPLQNCFGHCEYILRHDRYAPLREDKSDFSQVCPLKADEVETVFRSIFAEVAAMHPSEYIHIGCDETRLLGHCKHCAAFVEEHGKSALFVEYVKRMCALVKELGKTPVIWADILLQYPEAASELPQDVIVVDWNYGWKANHFGSVDNLLEKGFTMWGASSLRSSPDNVYLTQWDKHLANLRHYIPFCREKGFAGIIQTSWSTSGQYGYVRDHNSVVDIQPIREVYPAQAFDMLWQAFFEAVASVSPLPEEFVPEYLGKHFGLDSLKASALAGYFAAPQKPVTGKDFSAEKIEAALSSCKEMRGMLKGIRPRKNRRDFAHHVLMTDIRINYLEFKRLEYAFEFGDTPHSEIASGLKPLLRDASRLQRRFVRLNRRSLKDPYVPLGNHSYIQQMKTLYDICK